MPKKVQRRGRTQKGPEAGAPQQEETLVVPADVQRSDTVENQATQQETQTAQELCEKKKFIKVLLDEEKEEEVLECIKANPMSQTFPTMHDFCRLCSRLPNDHQTTLKTS